MPIGLMGGLALANAGLQLGGGIYNALNPPGVDQVNQYTEQQIAALQQAQAQAMAQYNAQQQQAQQFTNQLGGVGRDIQGTTQELGQVNQPGAMDWFDNWLGSVPGYQQIASSLAQSATQDLGRSIDEQVALDTQQAMTQAMNQFAGQGAYSGAAQASLGQAVAQPLAQARTQLTGQKAGIESGAFQNLAGQGAGLSAQGTQNEFANAMANLTSQLQGLNMQGGVIANQANQASQSAGQSAGLAANAQSQLSQFADPIFQQQNNPFAPFQAGATSALDILTNKSYGFPWTQSQQSQQVPQPQYSTSQPGTNFFNMMNPQAFQFPYSGQNPTSQFGPQISR